MSTQTIVFIGSTGGCTNACLTHALRAGHRCVALVRTPEKLVKKLTTDQDLDEKLISSNLVTVTGNAKSVADLKTALLAASPNGTSLPDTIVSGLGATGALKWEFCKPLEIIKADDPTLCRDSAAALIQALREVRAENPAMSEAAKPRLAFVSTTGVTRGPEDVPFSMRFMYHQMLAEPHKDKKAMEDVFRADAEIPDEKGRTFASVSCVRPTLLAGTGNTAEGKGLDKVKAGTEMKPELGYQITRGDVGGWMYANLVAEGPGRNRWQGNMCSLTT